MTVKSIAIKFIFFARFVRGSREKAGARERLVRVYNAREMCVREAPVRPRSRGARRSSSDTLANARKKWYHNAVGAAQAENREVG